MSNNKKYTKAEFIQFVISTVEHDCSDIEKSKEYLSSQGLNVETLISDGLKKIKKMQMKIEADKTRMEMISSETIKQQAEKWVDSLLNSIDFSLPELVRNEKLSMSFRNVEQLSQEDIKNILVKHFTLKFLKNQSNGF